MMNNAFMRIDNQGNILDKVDIVCHSMGFAYASGIIEVLKSAKIPLGRFYIVAPSIGVVCRK
jgi:hypothetical protein